MSRSGDFMRLKHRRFRVSDFKDHNNKIGSHLACLGFQVQQLQKRLNKLQCSGGLTGLIHRGNQIKKVVPKQCC